MPKQNFTDGVGWISRELIVKTVDLSNTIKSERQSQNCAIHDFVNIPGSSFFL